MHFWQLGKPTITSNVLSYFVQRQHIMYQYIGCRRTFYVICVFLLSLLFSLQSLLFDFQTLQFNEDIIESILQILVGLDYLLKLLHRNTIWLIDYHKHIYLILKYYNTNMSLIRSTQNIVPYLLSFNIVESVQLLKTLTLL